MTTPLYTALMKVLDATPAIKNLDDHEKTEQIINFIVDALQTCGHERPRILVSGYLGEARLAAQMKAVVNPEVHGHDVKDRDGNTHELKISNVNLGAKVNVNITVPVSRRHERADDYYDRLAASNKAKGNVIVSHTFRHEGITNTNTYTIDHEFLSMYMRHKNCWKKRNLNIGGDACTTCTRVHRLENFMDLQQTWAASGKKYDVIKNELDDLVISKCQ